MAVPRRVGHRGVRARGTEAVPPRGVVLPGQRGGRHRLSADGAHGHRRPLAIGARAVENHPGNPIASTRMPPKLVVTGARDARAGSAGRLVDGLARVRERLPHPRAADPAGADRVDGGRMARRGLDADRAGGRRRRMPRRSSRRVEFEEDPRVPPRRAVDVPCALPRRGRAAAHRRRARVARQGDLPPTHPRSASSTGDHSDEIEVDVELSARPAARPACCSSSTTGSSAAWVSTASGW